MRIQRLASVILGVLFLLGAGALLASAADNPQEKQEQEKQVKEEFAAWMNNPMGTIKTGQVMITIDRWSTPEERQELIKAYKEGGNKAMYKVLIKMPSVGYIRIPRTTAWELHYAYQFPTSDGGRIIVISTDRKIGFNEASMDVMSMDYPFEMIQMKLDAQNKGEGRLSMATRILVSKDGSGFELENYGQEPVALTNIHHKTEKDKEPEK